MAISEFQSTNPYQRQADREAVSDEKSDIVIASIGKKRFTGIH